MEENKMKTWKKALIWISSILVFLLVILPLLAGGFRTWIIPLYRWGFDIKAQTSAAAIDYPAGSYAPAPVAPTYSDEYHWGWDRGETKILKPNYCVAGDIVFEGTKFYDDGGVNETTVLINNSSRDLSVYSEWGAGEFKFIDKNSSITQIVMDEFATGGDPDAKTVRIVVVTDNGITQTWYNSDLKAIKTVNN